MIINHLFDINDEVNSGLNADASVSLYSHPAAQSSPPKRLFHIVDLNIHFQTFMHSRIEIVHLTDFFSFHLYTKH